MIYSERAEFLLCRQILSKHSLQCSQMYDPLEDRRSMCLPPCLRSSREGFVLGRSGPQYDQVVAPQARKRFLSDVQVVQHPEGPRCGEYARCPHVPDSTPAPTVTKCVRLRVYSLHLGTLPQVSVAGFASRQQ
jgi:hypothetical protein